VPSLATSLWLLVVAAAQPDMLSPPAHGRDAGVSVPAKPAATAPKAPPSVAKPTDPSAAKSPKAPSVPVVATPAIPVPQPGKTSKTPPRLETSPAEVVEPEEEIVADASGRIKASKRGPRKVATGERPERQERPEVAERKNPWSADRYAAVVPPGLTLAALRSQISKSPTPTADPGAQASEHGRPTQAASDIEKARESLRQETARLEAMLKTAGNCSGGGSGMAMGEPLLPTTPISAATLREAASEQIDTVSKAMKGMKPEQAAALLGRLDRGLAAEILRRMKSTDAGAILGLLKPDLAADLATEIAIRKPIYGKDKKASPK
jgi:flagellar motility protein MotE (MotC chaperone)